jgi:hypothetical protein
MGDERDGAYSTHKGKGNVCKILIGELEGERPLEKYRRSWNLNIKNI